MLVKKIQSIAVALTVITLMLSCPPTVPPAGASGQTVEFESGIYYTIKQGDTLWDIAQKFYGTPAAWPEVWRQNPQIANPHRLKPGTRIRIFGETRVQKIPETTSTQEAKAAEPPFFVYNSIDSVGLVRKDPVTSRGKIFAVRFGPINGKTTIGQDDLVYIKPAKGVSMTPGDTFYVYRKLKPVYNPDGVNFGPQYYVTGIAEIVTLEKDYVVARIVRSFRTISVDDLLLPYKPRSRRIVLTDSSPGIEGYLLNCEEGKLNFGAGDTAFIDKGRLDNIKVGQVYTVYMEKAFPEATVRANLGSLLVLHTEKHTATVLIVKSKDPLHSGVKIATPLP